MREYSIGRAEQASGTGTDERVIRLSPSGMKRRASHSATRPLAARIRATATRLPRCPRHDNWENRAALGWAGRRAAEGLDAIRPGWLWGVNARSRWLLDGVFLASRPPISGVSTPVFEGVDFGGMDLEIVVRWRRIGGLAPAQRRARLGPERWRNRDFQNSGIARIGTVPRWKAGSFDCRRQG